MSPMYNYKKFILFRRYKLIITFSSYTIHRNSNIKTRNCLLIDLKTNTIFMIMNNNTLLLFDAGSSPQHYKYSNVRSLFHPMLCFNYQTLCNYV